MKPDAMESVLGAGRLILGAVALASAVVGLVDSSVVAALNTFGFLGFGVLLFGGGGGLGTLIAGRDVAPSRRLQVTLIMSAYGLALSAMLFVGGELLGPGLHLTDGGFNGWTVVGLAAAAFGCVLASVSARAWSAGAHKTCPECAESVRAAARMCRFCGYRFVSPWRSAAMSGSARLKDRTWRFAGAG